MPRGSPAHTTSLPPFLASRAQQARDDTTRESSGSWRHSNNNSRRHPICRPLLPWHRIQRLCRKCATTCHGSLTHGRPPRWNYSTRRALTRAWPATVFGNASPRGGGLMWRRWWWWWWCLLSCMSRASQVSAEPWILCLRSCVIGAHAVRLGFALPPPCAGNGGFEAQDCECEWVG